MKYRELVSGWLAFAGSGAAAVAGGHADSILRATVYIGTGFVLAGVGYWMLASRPERRESDAIALDPRFRDLSETVGMTNENFVAWYQPIAEKQSEATIRFATRVLKHRRGHILGVEDGQEAARRNRDRWTFAVFLAAIGQVTGNQADREKGLSTLLLSIPESAREWLSRDPKVVESLTQAVLGQVQSNAIWRLVSDATDPVKPAETIAAVNEPEVTATEPNRKNTEDTEAPGHSDVAPPVKRQGLNTRFTEPVSSR